MTAEQPEVEFLVDTHVFRELGALLVGRDSTALAELIKNSYDADATVVYVTGTDLRDPSKSRIEVRDDGNGMTLTEFKSGFLTLASRSKDSGDRFTPRYRRRYTGAKGIGRLAAHKLARELRVRSAPAEDMPHQGEVVGVRASINWDDVESKQHLNEIGPLLDVQKFEGPISAEVERRHGTVVELRRLRKVWTEADISEFVQQMQGYEPPENLYQPSEEGLYDSPLLPDGLRVHSEQAGQSSPSRPLPGNLARPFRIELAGDFESGESWGPGAAEAAQYVLEIDSTPEGITYGIARTKKHLRTLPEGAIADLEPIILPASENEIYFQARIFMRSGQAAAWPRHLAGVRVYQEGFRVLPYGEPGNDWLDTDSDYVQRGRKLPTLGSKYEEERLFGSAITDEGLRRLPATGYIGAVFLNEETSGGLQMLVNREGFLPGAPLEELTSIVKRGLDLSTRVRARDQATKNQPSEARPVTRGRAAALAEDLSELRAVTSRLATLSSTEGGPPPTVPMSEAQHILTLARSVAVVTDDLLNELNMIRVLASVGSQLTAFVHELNGLLGLAARLQGFAADDHAKGNTQVNVMIDELKRGLERQASFLTDVTSVDARRRRSAQRVRDRILATTTLLADSALRRDVTFSVDADASLRTRPMFRAELSAILMNLLTNAVKAASEPASTSSAGTTTNKVGNVVHVQADEDDDALYIRVSNTGVGVDLADAEKWFDPYVSTTTVADASLGQGTGLGLTITRSLVADNAGDLKFVSPEPGYATTIQLRLPHKQARRKESARD